LLLSFNLLSFPYRFVGARFLLGEFIDLIHHVFINKLGLLIHMHILHFGYYYLMLEQREITLLSLLSRHLMPCIRSPLCVLLILFGNE